MTERLHSHFSLSSLCKGFPAGAVRENPPANVGDTGDSGSIPELGKIPWSRKWQPTPVFLPEKSHGQRSLADYSPWGCKELELTEQLILSFINGV